MSVNRNRNKFKKATNNHDDKIIWIREEYAPYCCEHIYLRGRLMAHEVRACKTWKHNRRKQYKQKE